MNLQAASQLPAYQNSAKVQIAPVSSSTDQKNSSENRQMNSQPTNYHTKFRVDAPEFIPTGFGFRPPQEVQQAPVQHPAFQRYNDIQAQTAFSQSSSIGGFQGRSMNQPRHINRQQNFNRHHDGGRQGQHTLKPYTHQSKFDEGQTDSDRQDFSSNNEKLLFGAEHVQTGIDFQKYDDVPVEASGSNVPKEISSFTEPIEFTDERGRPCRVNLASSLIENLKRAQYDKPTPIQKHAIPVGMLNRDVMACAQTGSGKTAAFLFPMISHIAKYLQQRRNGEQGQPANQAKPYGLVLAPTRELATQIFQECLRFCYRTSVHCVVVYGGAKIQYQISHLLKNTTGCNILVATPGRLLDLADRGLVSFQQTKFLVLDEADRMLDLGFEPQINRVLRDFDMPDNSNGRQTAMFSATFPESIQNLAASFMVDYVFITVGRVGATTKSITQNLLYVPEDQKLPKLLQLLTEAPPHAKVLIFMETKRACDFLSLYLNRSFGPISVSIHGDKSQFQREKALKDFKSANNQFRILVATDVAARGLDINNVAQVVNYDLPNDIDSYVHRIGRTGRAGNKGIATSFVNEKHGRMAKQLVAVLSEAEQVVPDFLHSLRSTGGAQSNRYQNQNHRSSSGANRQGYFGGTDVRQWSQQRQREPSMFNMYAQAQAQVQQIPNQGYYMEEPNIGGTYNQHAPSLPNESRNQPGW